MTRSRRTFLAAAATGTVALTAGCLDFALGNGPLELNSDRVAPTDAALEEAGYVEDAVEQRTVDETIDARIERDVEATVWLSRYSKTVDYQGAEREAGFFGAVSVPDFSVLGRSFNPIADMSNEELLSEFLDRFEGDYGTVDDTAPKESFALDILGDGRQVDIFEGEANYKGERIEIELAVTSFSHEDDLIVLLGTYPAALAEESANVEVLMESAEHPV